ncbi:putative RNA-directed DNA polymerase [Tanacetum coccineum]
MLSMLRKLDDMVELCIIAYWHMSEKGMTTLAKRKVISGLETVHLNKCSHCFEGKQNRVQFKSYPPSRKENILDLVYSVRVLSNEDSKSLVVLRPFDVYCREFGIRHHKTPPKTPQLNRIAKRLNRTLTFVHIPKDERSKLESKSRQCVFIGYKLYDPIEKKVIRSRDVDFMEDQTIKDIDKVKKSDAKFNNEHDIPFQVDEQNDLHNEQDTPIHFDDQDNHNDGHEISMHNYEQNDQPNVLNDQHDEQKAPIHVDEEPDVVQPRRSSRERQPSTRYSPHDYVLLTDGGERESYQEAMQPDDKEKWKIAMVEEMESLKGNHTYKLVELPKVKMSSIRVVLGLVASMDLKVQQLDVKTTFLLDDLEEEIYMDPRQWYKKFESFMSKQGYTKITSDHCVFFQKFLDKDFIILLLYVDDMLLVGSNIRKIEKLKKELNKSFAMKDLGEAKQILGMRISQDMKENKYLSNPGKAHWKAVKWILRYLRGTSKICICYGYDKPVLKAFTYFDMARDVDTRKSVSGYLVTFGGGAVSWQSRLQKCI